MKMRLKAALRNEYDPSEEEIEKIVNAFDFYAVRTITQRDAYKAWQYYCGLWGPRPLPETDREIYDTLEDYFEPDEPSSE